MLGTKEGGWDETFEFPGIIIVSPEEDFRSVNNFHQFLRNSETAESFQVLHQLIWSQERKKGEICKTY